jgi:hypothetical protein
MQNELDIVRDVSARLDGANIAYMLTGSMAMNYYAQPRMTRALMSSSLCGRQTRRAWFNCSAPIITFRAKRWTIPSRDNRCSI